MSQYSIYVCTDYVVVEADTLHYAENRTLRYLQEEGIDISNVFFLTTECKDIISRYPLIAEKQDGTFPSEKKEEDTRMYKEFRFAMLFAAEKWLEKQALESMKEDREDKFVIWKKYLKAKDDKSEYFQVHIKPFV